MTIVDTQDVVCQELASSTNGVRESTSLLGLVGRGMRLKVSRDEPRASDIVELASRRCLVGSAPSCDVRVNEPGVAPVECLIFHGTKNNVVRWLDASQEFAGGELFEDEILRAGDPLQIGPVELELLVDEIMAMKERSNTEEMSGSSEDRLTEYMSRLERLEVQLVEFNLLQEEVQRLRDELLTVRSEYGHHAANVDASDRLAEVSLELAERSEEFEQEQTDWERDRRAFQHQLQENIERLARFETQLAEQNERQAESETARQAAEGRADRLQQSVDELSTRLAVQREQNETDQPVRDFTSPPPESRDVVESEYPDAAYSDDEYTPSAYGARDDEEHTLRGLESAAYLNDAVPDEDIVEDPSLTAMEANRYAHANYASANYASANYASANYASAFEASEPVIDDEEEVAFETASSDPPVSTADVLARLGSSGVWNDDESGADESSDSRFADAGNSPRDAISRFAEPETSQPRYTPACKTPFAASLGNAASQSEEDEESIEAYMARLMNRVRATDDRDQPSKRPEAATERSPVTEYTEVAARPQSVREPEPEKFNAAEYKPRSQAPEMANRMTAMRSLANDSARSAIASHAKRNWSSVMKLKLLVSVFAFVAVLASTIFFWGNPLLMGLGSLVGVGVLVYWARTAITYRKLLLDSLMLEPGGGDDDESPSDEDAA
ncbi:MAG: hypothetical protein O3C40_15635 [Planctomycetota bacterium]|nr:hypothetical protein [Planctomycetota bacterium]